MPKKYHPRGQLVDGHPIRKHPLYDTWANMVQRCRNCKNPAYPNYGGRGIVICDEWADDFLSFIRDMGVKPEGDYSIDRVNGGEGYCKENCRWATKREQSVNRRVFKTNNTGFTGIELRKESYLATIQIDGKRYNLGRYSSSEEAASKRNEFEKQYSVDPVNAMKIYVRGANLNGSTGVRGVNPHMDGGFTVRVTENGIRKYLGYFNTLGEAMKAREEFYSIEGNK